LHEIEPYFNWRHLYIADEDVKSPFSGRQYSEFQYTQTVYNFYIHPQWDDIGSQTLYIKILFVDYDMGWYPSLYPIDRLSRLASLYPDEFVY